MNEKTNPDRCRLCGHEPLVEMLDLGQQPLANKYPTADQIEGEEFFPLRVLFCTSCKNVQLGTMISRERMFKDYYYLSSVNTALVRHFEQLAGKLVGAQFVVDVGSNDGILLRPLQALGVKAIGIEPSVNVSKIANDNGLATICAFFDDETVNQVVRAHGKADVIVASSVFTHLDDPHQFIEAAKKLLTPPGRLIIEVEYIGNIIRLVQFERFYLDRIFYYSLSSLQRLFARHGMSVTDVEHIEPHGGSLRVTVQGQGLPAAASVDAVLKEEAAILTRDSLDKFRASVDTQIKAFRSVLEDYRESKLRVAGYGSPARLSTICNYGKIGPSLISFTVDDSPLKQNRFTPGTHIPIVPKEHLDRHGADVLVVFAYEYFDDIRRKTEGKYRYLLPIPPREVK